ncbi:hypothetical protein SERLA73DRAFT_149614 [Serpula lacrymans var. lacrymans S7.3]|uniref:Uncharacterized protein n=1 Tax=Serpula lacrymans var. lacrymans (strain S7.3) TaxID=936435 RepID=F8PJM1_SERL3|nr:hypothetical protein SERLA73DRAFT_149614 [Serpula lacrymans var. lacrymans S7.3]
MNMVNMSIKIQTRPAGTTRSHSSIGLSHRKGVLHNHNPLRKHHSLRWPDEHGKCYIPLMLSWKCDIDTYPHLDYPYVEEIILLLDLAKTRLQKHILLLNLQKGGITTVKDIIFVDPTWIYYWTDIPVGNIMKFFLEARRVLLEFHHQKQAEIDQYETLLREGREMINFCTGKHEGQKKDGWDLEPKYDPEVINE